MNLGSEGCESDVIVRVKGDMDGSVRQVKEVMNKIGGKEQ